MNKNKYHEKLLLNEARKLIENLLHGKITPANIDFIVNECETKDFIYPNFRELNEYVYIEVLDIHRLRWAASNDSDVSYEELVEHWIPTHVKLREVKNNPKILIHSSTPVSAWFD